MTDNQNYKIGNINIKSNIILAPIAGYTDVGFRALCAGYGAGLTYTEMISAKGLIYGSEKTLELLHNTPVETKKAVQIFGGEPDVIAKAVGHYALQKFDIIDINMGCPVPKLVKNNEGSALLMDIPRASEIVRQAVRNTDKPITVKFRLGMNKESFVAVEMAKALQDAGAKALTVHGRYREQFYSGESDAEKIAEVVKSVNIPVFANGDIFDVDSYLKVCKITNAYGVMIARGALGNPYIFADILGVNYEKALRNDIIKHIEIMEEFHSDRYVSSNMKKHICYYCKGTSESKKIRELAVRIANTADLKKLVIDYFK